MVYDFYLLPKNIVRVLYAIFYTIKLPICVKESEKTITTDSPQIWTQSL
jgi:hypothetical protein